MPIPDPKPARPIILRFADGSTKQSHVDLGSVETIIVRDGTRFKATNERAGEAEYYNEIIDTKQ